MRRTIIDCTTGQAVEVPLTAEEQAQVDAERAVQSAAQAQHEQRHTNARTLHDRARQALTANDTFLALASPTNAQTLAQVRSLARQVNALIRLEVADLDSTAGT